jgi:hypothetical protein
MAEFGLRCLQDIRSQPSIIEFLFGNAHEVSQFEGTIGNNNLMIK